MKTYIFCFLLLVGGFLNALSAQSDSLMTELEKTIQRQIDTLGPEHLDIAMLSDSLGWMYMKTRKYPKADSFFTKALDIRLEKLEENHPDVADSYFNLGTVYDYMGNFEKAIVFHNKALNIRLELFAEKYPDVAKSYHNLGVIYHQTGGYEKAISFYNKALNIRLELFGEKHTDIADSYGNLGIIYENTGDYEKAIHSHYKALNIRLELFGEKHTDIANSYGNLGDVYRKTGGYEKAINFHNKALNIRLEILGEKHFDIAMSYNGLGNLHYQTGDYEKTINSHNKSLNVLLEILGEKHPDVAMSYNNLGVICMKTGDYEKAISLHNKALNIWLEVFGEKHPYLAMSYNNLGNVYEETGDYTKAISFHNKSLNIWLEAFDETHPNIAASYGNLGVIYRQTGDYEKAINSHYKSLNIWLETLDKKHPNVAKAYINLGNAYEGKGDDKKALDLYNKGLNIWLEVFGEKHPSVAEYYSGLAVIHETNSQYKIADSLWHMVIPQRTQQQKSTYLFLPNDQRIKYSNTLTSRSMDFYSFTVRHGTESTKQIATNYLLNTKSLALDYSISTNQLIQEINDTTLSSQYQQVNKLNKQLASAETLSIKERKAKGWDLSEIQEEQEALVFQMLQHPQLKAKLDTEIIEWQDVQNHLAPDEATIDFIEVYDEQDSLSIYYAVVIHKDHASPQFVRITDENTLSKSLQTDEDEHPDYLSERISRKALYKVLWQPLEPYLEGVKTVHISPSGILHRVSYESLQNMENKYLATQYEFHYYSAIRDMLKEKSQNNYEDMVLMGHILYDLDNKKQYVDQEVPVLGTDRNIRDGILPLPKTLNEVAEIKQTGTKAGLNTTLLTIDAASEDTVQYFIKDKAPDIFHFATHGVFLPPLEAENANRSGTRDRLQAASNPLQRSALMLYGANETWTKGRRILGSSEDGILTALEVTALDLQNTNLVVLSACSTGLGDTHNTEGVFGLQRAFKLAGVDYVVASLWNVDDESTKDLMVKFYENLLQKKQDPATALRNAKDYYREEGYAPEGWAGFILIE